MQKTKACVFLQNAIKCVFIQKAKVCVLKQKAIVSVFMQKTIVYAFMQKVSNGAKIRNRYNQVPHLTQDTNGKVTNSHKTPQTRAKRSALSQQVTTIMYVFRQNAITCVLIQKAIVCVFILESIVRVFMQKAIVLPLYRKP